jgi:putative GTP pyrophosphokinase
LRKHTIDAQIEYRTKDIAKFIEKIQREGKEYKNPLKEVTDLVGIRIIAYYKEDVDKIGEIIKKEFDVDLKNSIDKAQILDPDRFGYLSVHYVISLSPLRKELTEWKAFANIKAEIQVRTVLQHAWAAIDHKLRYKTAKEVPKTLRRQLFRLSALLEVADDEFSNLKRLIEDTKEYYSQEFKKGKLDIELDLSSLEVYLESTKQHLNWVKIAEQVGFKFLKEEDEDIEDIIEDSKRILLSILHLTGITTIEELDEILRDASQWGKDVLASIRNLSYKYSNAPQYYIDELGYVPFKFTSYVIITFLVIYARRKVVDQKIIENTEYSIAIQKAIREVITTK